MFSKLVNGFVIDSAEFIGGVYKISCHGYPLVVKPFVEDIVGEHMICKTLVEKILEDDEPTRDGDLLLLLAVWKAQGVDIDLKDVELQTMFNAESITRSRRKLQNGEGKFPPNSWAVAKRRGLNEELLREHYGKGDLCE